MQKKTHNPLATTNITCRPYWTALTGKSCGSICFFEPSIRFQTIRFWGITETGRCGRRTWQPEYINFSGVFEMKSRPEAWEDGWNCLAHLHTKVFGTVVLVEKKKEKKEKVFIGLVPSVFLWNVIITQAGHIYCIYRQRAGFVGAHYLSIFSQPNIWCKHENTMVKSARFIKSGFLALSSV